MMSPWDNPKYLERVWCVFELYMAHKIGCQLSLVMPDDQFNAATNALFTEVGGLNKFYEALTRTAVEKARASEEKDRIAILGRISEDSGYAALNKRVNDLLREWVTAKVKQFVVGLEDLASTPSDEPHLQPRCYAHLFHRLGHFFEETEPAFSLRMYEKSLTLSEQLQAEGTDNTGGGATTQTNIGVMLFRSGDNPGALDHFRSALAKMEVVEMDPFADEISCRRSMANLRGNIGEVLSDQCDFQGAFREFEEAKRLINSTSDSASGDPLESQGFCLFGIQESGETVRETRLN